MIDVKYYLWWVIPTVDALEPIPFENLEAGFLRE
jgi:hypothetical protein